MGPFLVKSCALPEAVVRRCSIKNVFLIISQESTCAGVSFLIKLQAEDLETLLKRDFSTGLFLFIFLNTFSCELLDILLLVDIIFLMLLLLVVLPY